MGIEISRQRIVDTAIRNNRPGRTLFNKKEKKVEDKRVSVCSECRRGIFTFQERVWTRRGLIHETCIDKGESETKVTT